MPATEADRAEETVRRYYESLREGEPLEVYFADAGSTFKFGVGESLSGYDEVEKALREQTRNTTDWRVESHNLRVTERDCHAWFRDTVRMAWEDTEKSRSYGFETRWSGTLEFDEDTDDWVFVGMHVSAEPEV